MMHLIAYDARDENRRITVHDAYDKDGNEGIIGKIILYPIDEAGTQLRIHRVRDVKYDVPGGKMFVVAERENLETISDSEQEECCEGEIVSVEFSSIKDYAIF